MYLIKLIEFDLFIANVVHK